MSVLVSKRKPSGVQYIDTARDLLIHSIRYGKKVPKSMMFFITKDLVGYARGIYRYVMQANSIYPKCKKDIEMRYEFLVNAKGLCDALDGLLSVLQETLQNGIITPYGWTHWGELIETEKRLINSVINSDSKLKFE